MSTTGSDSPFDPAEKYYYEIAAGDGEEEELHDYYGFQGPIKYKSEDFISRPKFSHGCNIEENILEFDFSYGYDCKKPYNLVVVDENTIVFASGNLIHFFDITTLEIWFRRSAKGGGLGHITNNPAFPHFAVGENGTNPLIIVYEWPSLEIVCVLKGGTGSSKLYTHLNYSPTGDLLVSQGGEPDYLITVWNWSKSVILLRTKSYVNDVYRVMFSPTVPGHLTSSGVAHIKFWKIASTFTGLKLQGNLGRFGKTEYTDIVGIYPMTDEKVISGCHWGNILVWEEGLIKLEVCRKNRKRCHDDAIVQFNYNHGELWTVGLDGHVKMWYYDTIDQADPPDDDRFCLMEPTYDFHTPNTCFMCIVKQYEDPENTFYFAQDAKGAIWSIDLNIEEEAAPSRRLLKSHAGITKGLAVCPWGPYFSTIGIGGWVHLYDYLTRTLLMIVLFPAPGAGIQWLPMSLDPSGECVLLAFGDGTVRIGVWKINVEDFRLNKIHIVQIEKPHSKAISVMSLNRTGKLFATGGEDKTLFFFQVIYEPRKYLRLVPIGYIPTEDVPTCITWHNTEENTIIVGCLHGQILTVEVPSEPVPYTNITYLLMICPITQRFHSYKSQVYRDILLRDIEKQKAAKRDRKMDALRKLRLDNPGLDIDEEVFLEDSEEEEELPPLFYPEEANKVHWIQHTVDNTLWVSMAGYDAGFIYEYRFGQSDPVPHRFQFIDGAVDNDIANYVYSKNKEYILFGMIDGSIRVNRVNPNDWHDLSNYWVLTMHDNFNGYIPGFSFSYDDEYFLTSGNDGNVFAFKFNPDEPYTPVEIPERIIPNLAAYKLYDDVDCRQAPSLEETIVNFEANRRSKIANANKQAYLQKILLLRERYERILVENNKLPDSQKLTIEELTVDQRIVDDLETTLAEELALVKRKHEFNVEKSRIRMQKMRNHFVDSVDMYPIVVKAICTDQSVRTIKDRRLDDDFYETLEIVDEKIIQSNLKGRPPERVAVVAAKIATPPKQEKKLEYFLAGLSPDIIENKLGAKINRLLGKYRGRKAWKKNRKNEWEIFNALKPSEISGDDDAVILRNAEEQIGDFKLKSAPDYKMPRHLRETTFKKYKQLLLVREKIFNMIHGANVKIFELREEKKLLHEYLQQMHESMSVLHEEILVEDQLEHPGMFEFGEEDYPENELKIRVTMDMFKEVEVQPVLIRPSEDTIQRSVLQEQEEDTPNDWELHMRQIRYRNLLYKQNVMVRRMKTAVNHFDTILEHLRAEIYDLRVESNLMVLHLLTLHQELLVLKECEQKEDFLSDKVNQKLQEVMDLQDENTELVNTIDMYKKEMDKLSEQEKDINKSFLNSVSDNKFFDFLKRIFKKKYKPPKTHTDDDSDSDSSSSSSDESEEEDAASIDSKDFGIIRLDENVCPKGCDPAIYEMTFQLRSQRHQIEQQVKEYQLQSEQKGKQKESVAKKVRLVESELRKRQDELEAFQREKQHKLNQIMCTVILKLSQMKHIRPEGGLNFIKNTLVFSQTTLTGLYQRVGILERERLDQREKHKLSVMHLKRMKTDFKLMSVQIKNLKKEIVEQMRIKFGSVVDINELEEYLLKKMIFDLRLSLSDVKGMCDEQIAHLYEVYKRHQISILRIYKQNTVSQDLLSMLKMEKAELDRTHEHQKRMAQNINNVFEQANKAKVELAHLTKIIQDQNIDMEALKNEIKRYKTKGFVLQKPKIEAAEFVEEEAYEEQSFVSLWTDNDDYMYTESYAKEYWENKKLQEARKTRQEVIYSIMDELFKNIKIQLHRNMIVNLLKRVVSDVMNHCDVKEIIEDILKGIPNPDQLSDEQTSLIEYTAERLYTIEEFPNEEINEGEDNEEEANLVYERTQTELNEIAESIFAQGVADPIELITLLITTILDQIPLHVVMEDRHMELLLEKVSQACPGVQDIDKQTLENLQMTTLEANILLVEFLDRVFRDVQDAIDEEYENSLDDVD